jgi:hypothetical protein
MLQYMLSGNILICLSFQWCNAALQAMPDNSTQQHVCMSVFFCPLYVEALHRTVVLTKQSCCSTLNSGLIEVKEPDP